MLPVVPLASAPLEPEVLPVDPEIPLVLPVLPVVESRPVGESVSVLPVPERVEPIAPVLPVSVAVSWLEPTRPVPAVPCVFDSVSLAELPVLLLEPRSDLRRRSELLLLPEVSDCEPLDPDPYEDPDEPDEPLLPELPEPDEPLD